MKIFRRALYSLLALALALAPLPALAADSHSWSGDAYGMIVDGRDHCIFGISNGAAPAAITNFCGTASLLWRVDNSTMYQLSAPGGSYGAWAPTFGAVTAASVTSTGAVSGTTGTFTGVVTASAGTQGAFSTVALSAASATTFATVTMVASTRVAGTLYYSIEADDATDYQARSGVLPFNAVMKGTAITCSVATVTSATEVAAVSSGTITNTFTCADGTAGALQLKANAASSLTETTLRIRYRLDITGTATVTGS